MSIDWTRWRHALAMTESNSNPRAWGDQGLACGRWQMHPVFVDRWWPDDFEINDHTSWDDLFERCLHAFFNQYNTGAAPETLAAWFHEHGGEGPITDHAYVERFLRFYEEQD